MTKFLSQVLEAPEPFFRQGLRRLEAANGHPNTDIRFSAEVNRAAKDKLRELGLDPHDTTPRELYHFLQERVKADDKRLNRTLRTAAATHVSAEGDVVAGMVHALEALPDSKRCFALKASVFKSIIKKVPPKKTLKQLGYRSLDSFLKHESPVTILSAAWLTEDASWQRRLLTQYKQLKPGDFEDRKIAIVKPSGGRWQQLAEKITQDNKHNVLCLKELGALVLLPLPKDAPDGSTLASFSLAAHGLNEIRASSTFLKLCQVRGDFGKTVQSVVADEPRLSSQLLDEAVPWHIVHRFYDRMMSSGRESAFEPHLQLDEMTWQPIEKVLHAVDPELSFWRHTAHLGTLADKGPVSFNVVDAALSVCNNLPFERRVSTYFKQSLWHELLLRYLRAETVEQAVAAELQPQLAEELVTA